MADVDQEHLAAITAKRLGSWLALGCPLSQSRGRNGPPKHRDRQFVTSTHTFPPSDNHDNDSTIPVTAAITKRMLVCYTFQAT